MTRREGERIMLQLHRITRSLNATPEDFDAVWDAVLEIRKMAKVPAKRATEGGDDRGDAARV